MELERLQNFLDESEIVLHGVRGGLLMFAQDLGSRTLLDIPLRRMNELARTASDLELDEVRSAALDLATDIGTSSDPSFDVKNEHIRVILDKVSALESILAGIRMSQDDFAIGLSQLVDEGFENISAEETVDDEWPSDDADDFEVDAELLEVFAEEADDLLKNIETNLARLVSRPDDKDALWEIRRNAHTFKGSAGIVGLKRPSELAHRVEDLLDRLVETEHGPNDQIIPLLLTATDCLKAMAAGENTSFLTATVAQLHEEFDAALRSIEEPEAVPAASTSVAVPVLAEQPEHEKEAVQTRAETRAIVRVSLDKLDDLVGIIRDLVISRSVFEQRLSEFDRQIDDLHNATRRLQSTNTRLEVDFEAAMLDTDRGIGPNVAVSGPNRDNLIDPDIDQFDSLEFDRYTEFHQAIRELTETSSDTFAINTSLEALKEDLGTLFEQQRKLIDAIQEKVMRIRLVAFGSLKTRLDRAVRVTCDEEGKKAEVFLENQELEVDTQILDSLIEPLLHLLKNAVVHGIEFPEMRRLLGKSETGRINVRLASEETHIVLTVSDDGGGIATGALKERAVMAGVISRQVADSMSDEQANDLIFLPGLTTAQKLNLNAGRGVGMNIVKDSIESKKGTITINSIAHKGTTFTVRMPLPLAVTTALLVRSGQHTFAVPFKLVSQVAEIEPGDITKNGSDHTCRVGGKVYELRHIEEILRMEARLNVGRSVTAFLTETSAGAFAIAVDSVVRSEEIVIKPLGRPLDSTRGILGAAILGNGQLVTILDVPYLVSERPEPKKEEPVETETTASLTVMIVDDSPSVRLMTSKVIKGAGWEVVTAKDGVDALEILGTANDLPAVILSDIEMPRMGGFELVSALKSDDKLKHIPVIVISSRAGDKHREKAFSAGVSEYLVKPYSDWELIQKIQSLAEN